MEAWQKSRVCGRWTGSTAADLPSVDEVHELGAGQSSCAVYLLIGLLDKAAHHLLHAEEGRQRSEYRHRE